MGWGFIREIPAIITSPVAAFREMQEESPFHALFFFGFLFLLYLILSFLAFALQFASLGVSQHSPSDLPVLLLPHALIQILLLIYLAIYVVWTHALGVCSQREEGLRTDGEVPPLRAYPPLLGYISQIFLAAGIWSLALIAVGIKELQGISPGRAVAATVIPSILFVISIFLLFFTLVL